MKIYGRELELAFSEHLVFILYTDGFSYPTFDFKSAMSFYVYGTCADRCLVYLTQKQPLQVIHIHYMYSASLMFAVAFAGKNRISVVKGLPTK